MNGIIHIMYIFRNIIDEHNQIIESPIIMKYGCGGRNLIKSPDWP